MNPIAILIDRLSVGGAEKVAVTLANELAARGHSVDFLTCRSGDSAAFAPVGVRVISLRDHKSGGAIGTVRYLTDYLKTVRPAILFSFLERPSLLALVAAQLAGYHKVVPTVHVNLHAYALLDHRFRRTVLKWLVRLLYPRAACLIAVSEGVATSVREVTRYEKVVHVIYNGFDLAALRAQSQAPVQFAWLDEPAIPVIVSCGRLVPQKGFDTLLQAFAHLQALLPSRLIILGEGPQREGLTAQARRLGVADAVAMPGVVPNPIAWFAKANLFVLSSRAEGLSNVLTEALVAGVPLVSTDCRSGPAEILADGQFGRLVPVDDVAALTASMLRALTQKSEHRPVSAHHLKKFSLARMVDGYLDVVVRLSESPSRNHVEPDNQGGGLASDSPIPPAPVG